MEISKISINSSQLSTVEIDRTRLRRNEYFMSLLQEGQRTQLITGEKAYEIQVEMVQLLQDLIGQFTQGETSSVTTDKAEEIMISILFALDTYALYFEDPVEAIAQLNSKSVKEIHREGVELLRDYFEEAKVLYSELKKVKLDVQIEAYNLTIDESLPIFLNNYNIIFEAQNTMASIDYPLALDDMRLQGVFYIKQYIERLLMETQFCHLFSQESLLFILINFGKMCRFNYRIELFNVFELMINNSIFSLLAGGKADEIKISEVQYEHLKQLLSNCNAIQRTQLIHESFDQMQVELHIDPKLTHYINIYRNMLIQRINNAVEIGNFDTLVIREIVEQEKPMLIMLNENERLSDNQMRHLFNQIMDSHSTADKIQLIRGRFVSLYDYLDLFNAGCLFDNEYYALFNTFGDIELAILSKIVFYEELRGDDREFIEIITDGSNVVESEWQTYFNDFMQQLSEVRVSEVGRIIYNIDYEEISFY